MNELRGIVLLFIVFCIICETVYPFVLHVLICIKREGNNHTQNYDQPSIYVESSFLIFLI